MKLLWGLLLIVGGVVLGLWAGLWWAFIGGVVQVVEAVKASPVEAMEIAFGLARVASAGFIGVASAGLLIVPGMAVLEGA